MVGDQLQSQSRPTQLTKHLPILNVACSSAKQHYTELRVLLTVSHALSQEKKVWGFKLLGELKMVILNPQQPYQSCQSNNWVPRKLINTQSLLYVCICMYVCMYVPLATKNLGKVHQNILVSTVVHGAQKPKDIPCHLWNSY